MLGIEILKRLGGGAGRVDLQDGGAAGTTTAHWMLGGDGFTYYQGITTGGLFKKSVPWIYPQQGMDQYEVQATVTTGDTPSGTIGSYTTCAVGHTWGFVTAGPEKECDLLLEIRRAVGHAAVDSATVNLSVSGTE